jgi:ketosteroid isomerase-like protein
VPVAIRAMCLVIAVITGSGAHAAETGGPESVLRALVQANADKDFAGLARHMAQDSDVVGYTIGGRKYVGWAAFASEMQQEFESVQRLEIPITDLRVWRRGDVAWFAMELDYIRHVAGQATPVSLPLRETGVLEKRDGRWVLVAWHESSRTGDMTPMTPSAQEPKGRVRPVFTADAPDLSGEWEIHEEDKSYVARLDKGGNGPYTHKGGRFTTNGVADRKWQGTWQQSENDREGGFELLLSEDGNEARGVWWYTRVGDRTNIPPRQWGGSYHWKRMPSSDAVTK